MASEVIIERVSKNLKTMLILIWAVVVVATYLFLRFGTIGDCNTTADCPPGKTCLTGLDETHTLVHWFRPEKRCLRTCIKHSDCPAGEKCGFHEDRFGPDSYCSPPKTR